MAARLLGLVTVVTPKPEVRRAIKLKKTFGTPQAADCYWRARQCAAMAVAEAKSRVWEEFGEVMERDFRSAPKKFCQTIWHLRSGGRQLAHTVYSGSRELITSIGEIVGW